MAINEHKVTLAEARKMFKIELDKDGSYASPAFIETEIDYFLLKSFRSLLNRKISGNNQLTKGLEQTQKRYDDLKPLYKTAVRKNLSSTIDTPFSPYSSEVDLSTIDDYFRLVSTHVAIKPMAGATGKWAECWEKDASGEYKAKATSTIETKLEELDGQLEDVLSDHHINRGTPKPLEVQTVDPNTGHSVIKFYGDDNYYVSDAKIVYIKQPTLPASPTEEFEVDWVDEIVAYAASLAKVNVGDEDVAAQFQLSTSLSE